MRGGGGEHTAFVLTQGWIIHPAEKSASLPSLSVCVYSRVCVSMTACQDVVMLYLGSRTCGNVFCLTFTTHTTLTTLQVIFISYAWFSLSLADAKWLSVLCMLLVVRFILLRGAIRCRKTKETTMYVWWITPVFPFSVWQNTIPISDLFDRQRHFQFLICT